MSVSLAMLTLRSLSQILLSFSLRNYRYVTTESKDTCIDIRMYFTNQLYNQSHAVFHIIHSYLKYIRMYTYVHTHMNYTHAHTHVVY